MKKILILFITILSITSCVTPSQLFLAKKHHVNNKDVKIIWESRAKSDYSPFFHTKTLLEFSEYYLTNENKDSIISAYEKIRDEKYVKKNNCLTYDVIYSLNHDTINQKVYFIETRDVQVTHDNDIINRMFKKIEENIKIFEENNSNNVIL
jgi:hypothetical protein